MHANTSVYWHPQSCNKRESDRRTFAMLYMACGSMDSRWDLPATIRTSSGVQSWPRFSSARGSRRRLSREGGAEGGNGKGARGFGANGLLLHLRASQPVSGTAATIMSCQLESQNLQDLSGSSWVYETFMKKCGTNPQPQRVGSP